MFLGIKRDLLLKNGNLKKKFTFLFGQNPL